MLDVNYKNQKLILIENISARRLIKRLAVILIISTYITITTTDNILII